MALDAIALAAVFFAQWYGRRVEDLRERQDGLLRLALTVQSVRDPSAARHAAATGMYARDLAAAVGLPPQEQSLAHTTGLLHDLRQTGLSEEALSRLMGDARLTQVLDVLAGEHRSGEWVACVARAVAVAETYDRAGPEPEQAAASLRQAAETHLDPDFVELFLDRVAPQSAGGLGGRRGGRFGRGSTPAVQAPPPS